LCFSYIVCFVNCLVFNTGVNVYFQGNRKCSFLPGCACLYLYKYSPGETLTGELIWQRVTGVAQ